MECSKCGELHTGGFVLSTDPPQCVFCFYGREVSCDQYGVKTRAQDRAHAEAGYEMGKHQDASGHRRTRVRFKPRKVVSTCETCGFVVERAVGGKKRQGGKANA